MVNKGGLAFQSAARYEGNPAPLINGAGFPSFVEIKKSFPIIRNHYFFPKRHFFKNGSLKSKIGD